MKGSDFQVGHIEALAEHVDAYDEMALTAR
jgi:hypothetical protein